MLRFKDSYGALCTTLNEFEAHPHFCSNPSKCIGVLSVTLTSFVRYARYVSEQASERKDAASAAIFTKIGGGIDKWLWFVETSQ